MENLLSALPQLEEASSVLNSVTFLDGPIIE